MSPAREPKGGETAPAAGDVSLDLPEGMFRSGTNPERTVIVMQRLLTDPVYTDGQFTEVDGLALFEGDVVLATAEEARNATTSKGVGIVGDQYRWPEGKVFYVFEPNLQKLVDGAIRHWEERTPIRFIERTTQADYVSFERQNGSWSRVGRQGGRQVISLGSGCVLGSAIHEIGHTLGLWHEQSRSDRDSYITLKLENVDEAYAHNFDKHVQDGTDLGDYDYESIMHYPATAFSKNGQPTIVTKSGGPIGQRNGLSKGDILAIKLMYPTLDWSAAYA